MDGPSYTEGVGMTYEMARQYEEMSYGLPVKRTKPASTVDTEKAAAEVPTVEVTTTTARKRRRR